MTEHEIPDDIYKEHILELYKHPQNFGLLKNPTHEATKHNSVCGDEITAQLLIKEGIVKDIKFQGSGCVIAIVAASLLSEKLKGMSTESIKKMNPETVLSLLHTKLTPSRIKCALLAFEAVKEALR